MIVRHLHNDHELLSVLAQPTEEMHTLRQLLTQQGRFPTRRTWERRLKAIPATLPAQIGCLGRHLISLIQPWLTSGRAVAIDSTILRARGGVWHQKHREQGELPHTSIDPEARLPQIGVAVLSSMAGNCTWSQLLQGRVSPCRCADSRQYRRLRPCSCSARRGSRRSPLRPGRSPLQHIRLACVL
jgi:hypothetical protein